MSKGKFIPSGDKGKVVPGFWGQMETGTIMPQVTCLLLLPLPSPRLPPPYPSLPVLSVFLVQQRTWLPLASDSISVLLSEKDWTLSLNSNLQNLPLPWLEWHITSVPRVRDTMISSPYRNHTIREGEPVFKQKGGYCPNMKRWVLVKQDKRCPLQFSKDHSHTETWNVNICNHLVWFGFCSSRLIFSFAFSEFLLTAEAWQRAGRETGNQVKNHSPLSSTNIQWIIRGVSSKSRKLSSLYRTGTTDFTCSTSDPKTLCALARLGLKWQCYRIGILFS